MTRAKDDENAVALGNALLSGAIERRREAARELARCANDMRDVRAAQPALVLAMLGDDAELKRCAVQATLARVEAASADVALAFPGLYQLVKDADPIVRRDAWTIVSMADTRHAAARSAFLERAIDAHTDPDADVRRWAARSIGKMHG